MPCDRNSAIWSSAEFFPEQNRYPDERYGNGKEADGRADWKLLEHCHHCSTIIMQNSSHLKRREEIFCNWKGQAASSNRSFWSKPAASMQSCRSCFGIEWALVVGFEVAAWRSRGVPMTLRSEGRRVGKGCVRTGGSRW